MKLTIKDLKQQKFVIDAEPTTTIAELKAKIQEDKSWPTTDQKLIYSGKILKDADTVASYNIEEKGFIVCMISKPKAAPASASPAVARAPSTPAPSSNTTQTPAAPAAAPVSSTSAGNVPSTPTPAPQSQSNVSPSARRLDDPSSLATGNERTEAIASMEAMGFPRDQIDRAMRAAFFNPDRAVEYLLSGIPEHLQRDDRPAAPAAARSPAPAATQPSADSTTTSAPATAPATSIEPAIADLISSGGGESGGEEPFNMFEAAAAQGRGGARSAGATAGAGAGAGAATAAGTLEFLRSNPQFQQLRHLVQQQPQMLEPIMQQLAQGNPQLAAMIRSSPEEFLELLAEDNDDDTAVPPGAQVVSISEEERDAIERLCRLGFERDMVIQAYFACDKNEELAANFLFDQPDEDEQ